MKKDNLYIYELKNFFSDQKSFRKSGLRDFYRKLYDKLDEKTFRRILYALEKENIVTAVDRGTYILGNDEILKRRKGFIPTFSLELKSLSDSIQAAFPYTEILIWETRVLYDFMIHQPGQNLIILEAEKEAIESIFNFLENESTGKVFLDPNQDTVERYALRNAESIIVMPLISRSPHQSVNGVPCPKLEKILVDIFSDKEKFFILHGQELVNIYENAFQNYLVGEKTFFSYARRRKVHLKIRAFITKKTNIQLIQAKGKQE
jgi:hypothetical protein